MQRAQAISATDDLNLAARDYTFADSGNRGGRRGSSIVGLYRSVAKPRAYLLRPVGSAAREKHVLNRDKFRGNLQEH